MVEEGHRRHCCRSRHHLPSQCFDDVAVGWHDCCSHRITCCKLLYR
jgi:hypothetical protein